MKENKFDIVSKLEFDHVLNLIIPLAKSERGATALNSLVPFSDPKLLERSLNELDEMMRLINEYGELPLAVSFDLSEYIIHAVKGGILTPKELDRIGRDSANARMLISFMNKLATPYLLLDNYVSELVDLSPLEKSIQKVINGDLTINDHASHDLYKIRQKILSFDSKITGVINRLVSEYSGYLTDNLVTMRDGHYVLPVKTVNKNKVPGIALAISDSGATTFIEPDEVMALNSELARLHSDEMEEVNRLLRKLTSEVVAYQSPIKENNELIGQLDFIHAKARYARMTNANIAKTSFAHELYLPLARHPLIDPEIVVANTFKLTNDERLMVISGPNAGGKTVALKTVGLLVYMHQVGLALPTSDIGTVPFIDRLFVDIGDSQSLRDNLSTFSGHLANLTKMTADLSANDFVIIDELGTGTDPVEGEALAIAVCEYIATSGALGLVSSHFSGLKNYALTTPGVFNGSMLFNGEQLEPTYRLQLHIPGQSYGLVVAKRYGLNPKIVAHAEEIIASTQSIDHSKIYHELEKEINKNVALNKSVLEKEQALINEQNKLAKEKEKYETERRKLSEEFNERMEAYTREAEEKINQIIIDIKNATKPHEITAAKTALKELNEPIIIIDKTKADEDFVIGDAVYLPHLEIYGEIQRIQGNKISLVTSKGLTFTVKKSDLVHAKIEDEVKPKVVHHVETALASPSVGLELNVIGLRVDEALNEVSRYLDQCLLKNYTSVRIIHGSGTGALRKAIHEYLATKSYVKSYRLGGPGEGSAGATVVNFRE